MLTETQVRKATVCRTHIWEDLPISLNLGSLVELISARRLLTSNSYLQFAR